MALALLAAAEAIASAGDDPKKFGLAWMRDAGAKSCATPSAAVQRVRERLGYDPFAVDATTTIEVALRGETHGHSAEIRVRSDGGDPSTRTLESRAPDCGPLVEALILAIAVIIDPDAALEEKRPPPTLHPPNEEPAPTPPSPKPPRRAPRPPPAAPSLAWSTFATVDGALAIGLAPAAAPGARLAIKLLHRSGYAVEAGALWASETSGADAAYRFGTTAGWLGGCRAMPIAKGAAFDACAELWIGASHAVVFGRAPFEPGQRLLAAIAASPRLSWAPLPHFVLEVGGHVLFNWLRNEFRVTDRAEPIYTQPLFGLIGFAGVGLTF